MNREREEKVLRMLSQRLESLTVIAEATYLRHNISAILRSAEAFGVHDVHLITEERVGDTGVARGAEKWVDIHKHSDTLTCIKELKEKGFRIYVADLNPSAKEPASIPIDQKIAVLMGTELSGVSDVARKNADGFVIIPMRGLTQSLNVSVACACILFLLAERRRAFLGGGDLCQKRQKVFFDNWKSYELSKRRGISARQSLDQRIDGKD